MKKCVLCEFKSCRERSCPQSTAWHVQAAVNGKPSDTARPQVQILLRALGDKMMEVEMAEDVKEFLVKSHDVHLADALKKKIMAFDDDDLVLVTKEIGNINGVSGTHISDVKLVTPELIMDGLK